MLFRLERAEGHVAHRPIEESHGLRSLLPIDVTAEGLRESRIQEFRIKLRAVKTLWAHTLKEVHEASVLLLPDRAPRGRRGQAATKVDGVGGEIRRGTWVVLGRRLRLEELCGGGQGQQRNGNRDESFHARNRSQERLSGQANRAS